MRPKTRRSEDERPAPGPAAAVIGPDLVVAGELAGDVDLVVEGRVLGSIDANLVVIAEGAHVDATLFAEKLVIHGRYFGRATAPVVEVGATAQISGSIVHNAMTAEKGAVIDGLMPWRPVNFFEQGAHEYELAKGDSAEGRQP